MGGGGGEVIFRGRWSFNKYIPFNGSRENCEGGGGEFFLLKNLLFKR